MLPATMSGRLVPPANSGSLITSGAAAASSMEASALGEAARAAASNFSSFFRGTKMGSRIAGVGDAAAGVTACATPAHLSTY